MTPTDRACCPCDCCGRWARYFRALRDRWARDTGRTPTVGAIHWPTRQPLHLAPVERTP